MSKKIGIAMVGEFKYYEALRIAKANGFTENDKEAIFEEYKKLGGRYIELPPDQVEGYPKVDGFILEVKGSRKKPAKKVKKPAKKKKK